MLQRFKCAYGATQLNWTKLNRELTRFSFWRTDQGRVRWSLLDAYVGRRRRLDGAYCTVCIAACPLVSSSKTKPCQFSIRFSSATSLCTHLNTRNDRVYCQPSVTDLKNYFLVSVYFGFTLSVIVLKIVTVYNKVKKIKKQDCMKDRNSLVPGRLVSACKLCLQGGLQKVSYWALTISSLNIDEFSHFFYRLTL